MEIVVKVIFIAIAICAMLFFLIGLIVETKEINRQKMARSFTFTDIHGTRRVYCGNCKKLYVLDDEPTPDPPKES